jgi:hypothetical protein
VDLADLDLTHARLPHHSRAASAGPRWSARRRRSASAPCLPPVDRHLAVHAGDPLSLHRLRYFLRLRLQHLVRRCRHRYLLVDRVRERERRGTRRLHLRRRSIRRGRQHVSILVRARHRRRLQDRARWTDGGKRRLLVRAGVPSDHHASAQASRRASCTRSSTARRPSSRSIWPTSSAAIPSCRPARSTRTGP